MTRKDNSSSRCPRCRMHSSLCVCEFIPRLITRTHLVLVIHHREDRKTTNTGRLAVECLVNSTVVVRGQTITPSETIPIAPGSQPILLYPAEDAVPLTKLQPLFAQRPITLIVPDGNWRQASKVRTRVPGMRDIPCALLPAGDIQSSYRLRYEAHEHGLATLEAIARALGIIEGPDVQSAIERPFRAMVERSLWSRGTLTSAEVSSGIPEGVKRHDPLSGTGRVKARSNTSVLPDDDGATE